MAGVPFKKNQAADVYLPGLVSQADTDIFQVNPTIAASDFKISTDGTAFTATGTLPDVYPAAGRQVRIQLSAEEMNGDAITLIGSDQAGDEWCDIGIVIYTDTAQVGEVATSVGALNDISTAQVNTEVDSALSDIDLDHLIEVTSGAEDPTVGSYIDQMMNKAAGQTFDPTADSLEAIRDRGDAAWTTGGAGTLTAALIWAYVTRGLTQSAAQVAAAVAGSALAIRRGDTFTANLTGLGSIANRTKLWFTVKKVKADADSSAIIQIEETEGLIYLNSDTGASGQGSITVTDEDAGNITIVIDEVATAELVAGLRPYDVQVRTDTGDTNTLTEANATMSDDVTRATS